MSEFDALRSAESIVANAARSAGLSATAGLRLPPRANPSGTMEAKIVSVVRGVVTAIDVEVGITRQFVAPPLIAESLKRTYSVVRLEVDADGHIITFER